MKYFKGIKNKIICFFKGHVHKKEDTELDLIGGHFHRLHDFETDYKNKCRRCDYVLRWTSTPFGSWKNNE